MAQVDHRESDEVATHEVDILAIKTDEQSPEFVDPGKGALTGKTMFVDVGIEEALTTSFRMLAVAPVFGNVRNDTVIEAHFASRFGIKSTISIEVSTLRIEAQALHGLEGSLEVGL